MNQNAVGQLRLSSETLGKLTSECTLVTPEVKPTKPVRGSVLITKGKAESHGSGSQKQHHQHSSETPQVQIRAPQKEGWDSPSSFPLIPFLLLPLLLLASCIWVSTTSFLQVPWPGRPGYCPCITPEGSVLLPVVKQVRSWQSEDK